MYRYSNINTICVHFVRQLLFSYHGMIVHHTDVVVTFPQAPGKQHCRIYLGYTPLFEMGQRVCLFFALWISH